MSFLYYTYVLSYCFVLFLSIFLLCLLMWLYLTTIAIHSCHARRPTSQGWCLQSTKAQVPHGCKARSTERLQPRLVSSNPPRPKYPMDAKLGAQKGCNQGWCLAIHQAPSPNNFMDAKLGAQKGCTMSPLQECQVFLHALCC